MNQQVEIIPIDSQALVRSLIADRSELSLAHLATHDARALLAAERNYWRQLYAGNVPLQWKAAIRLTYSPDANGVRSFSFEGCTATLDKHNGLLVKESAQILYDDREAGRERALPGEWMLTFAATIADEAYRVQRVKERQEEAVRLDQIERLKG